MSAFGKEFLRTITRKPGRFLALLAIVALGAGFYAGLRMTAPDMDRAIDRYLDGTHGHDIRVVSTLGLTDDDLQALRGVKGVDQVMGAFECDAMATLNGSDYTMRFHSLPVSAANSEYDGASTVSSDDDAYLNRIVLAEGSWPQRNDECVVCADRIMDSPYGVGDTITIDAHVGSASSMLEERTYTIVGLVRSPNYVSQVGLGSSSLGSGVVQQYVYVPESDFKRTVPYTEAFVSVKGASDEFFGSDAYWEKVGNVRKAIEEIAPEREKLRDENFEHISSLRFADEVTTYNGSLDLLEFKLENPSSSLDEAGKCEWLIMDRDKNAGTVSFTSDAERVDHIAGVFPFVFFLVAALVALTTMTRMVDEDRLLIGTYKALGYSRGRITWKYVGYALLASGLGALIGIVFLGKLLPAVIMNAYAIMYWVPSAGYPLDAGIAFLSAGLSVAITFLATWFSVSATLRERPAALLLPPAPKAGKRILLERIAPVWSRLSFSWKVTCRNLFRYKKRFIMTVIGIAGCTALLLTGLGLHDAINDIIDVQYTDIVHDNATITVHESIDEADEEKLADVLADERLVHSSTRAHVETMLASGPRASDKRADIVVPEDPDAFADMMTLRSRTTHELVPIPDGASGSAGTPGASGSAGAAGGSPPASSSTSAASAPRAVANEKLSSEIGAGAGDEFELSEQDAMGNAKGERYRFAVDNLMENYVYNYVFVSADSYERATGKAPTYTTYFVNVTDDPAGREELDQRLSSIDGVKTFSYNDETIESYRTMLRSVDLIVVVLVVSAAALAFIVLYNLTNINIEERIREIATLKVLGFTRREMNAYIFREVTLLSIIGCVIGLLIGVPLESFVVTTAEVDQVMFGRTIHPESFVWGFVLTLVFSAIAMALMLPKLKRIDMVESLKSNE